MTEFLVEAYVSRASASGDEATRPEDLSRVSDQLTREGRPVQLVRSVFVPGDEVRLFLFEAQSNDAVAEATRRCGLRFERLVEAVTDWCPAQPNPKESHRALQETVHRP